MKKSKLIGAMLLSMCMIAGSAVPAMADSVKVVTLGADLSEAQKNTMLKYFKVNTSEIQILTITNQDEREHLSAYVPIEQIGTRTVSCAYVKPTQSGGIKVRTANLNWVTGNMIATSLSTSGVKNCEVVAACPFEVSGTGALTGVQMAYEAASGETLDATKKQLATQEIVVTGELADSVGQNQATTVVNQSKMEVIQNDVQNADEIYNIVVNIAQQNNIELDSEKLDEIVSLLEGIAQQDYNYDDIKETLERVEANVTGETAVEGTYADEDSIEDDSVEEDSIVDELDESVLGENVIASSTEDPTLEEETGLDSETSTEEIEGIPEAQPDEETYDTTEEIPTEETYETELPAEETVDGTTEAEIPTEETVDGTTEAEIPTEETMDGTTETEVPAETAINLDLLTEEARTLYQQAETFCAGEYEGDTASLETALGQGAVATVVLDAETGSKLTDEVLKIYYNILNEGTAAYVPSDMDMYMTPELNMLDTELKTLFSIDTVPAEDILANVAQEDKQILYSDTMAYFETLYGESTTSYDASMDTETYDETGYDETMDTEGYEEEYYEEIPQE